MEFVFAVKKGYPETARYYVDDRYNVNANLLLDLRGTYGKSELQIFQINV